MKLMNHDQLEAEEMARVAWFSIILITVVVIVIAIYLIIKWWI
jgi:uncharacterized Rmd1/YagE family protein